MRPVVLHDARTSDIPPADSGSAAPTIDLRKLPPGAMFTRILAVDYVRLRTADEGHIYLTRSGVPFWRHLQPENWYEGDYFRANRVRLEGTGTVYRVPTRPLGRDVARTQRRSIDLVVKWSRVGEDVPLDTYTLSRAISTEFNTPFEEFSLLESLRRGEHGPAHLRVLTQKPLAIYVPPERMQLWQTGRSRDKILAKVHRHPAVEIDVLRSYIMLYGWVDGVDAVQALGAVCASEAQVQVELKEFTLFADAEIRAKGFVVADHKPAHLIVRVRDGAIRRRRDGRIAYAIVDYELLSRTPEHDHAVGSARRRDYFTRQRDRFVPRPRSAFPPHLAPVTVLGVDYVYGRTESTRGKLWVLGNDPELFGYFLPERWRYKQVVMSPKNEVYYVHSKDRLHLLWKVSSMGDAPGVEAADPRCAALAEQGHNSPFEEFALAIDMRRKGLLTVHPRAIYATGRYRGVPGCVADTRPFDRLAGVLGPDRQPVMPPDHDYVSIWGYWRGLEDAEAIEDVARWNCIDAAQACRAEMITIEQLDRIVERQRRRLAAAGFVDANLRGEHVLLSYIPGGAIKREGEGEAELVHCNFEFVRRLPAP